MILIKTQQKCKEVKSQALMGLLVKKEHEGDTEIEGEWTIETFVEEEYWITSYLTWNVLRLWNCTFERVNQCFRVDIIFNALQKISIQIDKTLVDRVLLVTHSKWFFAVRRISASWKGLELESYG